MPKPKKDKYKNKYKGKKDDSSDDDDEKKKNKPYKKYGKKKEFHKKNKNDKAYIVGDWLTDIELSSGLSDDESENEKENVAALVIVSSLSPSTPRHHPLHTYASWTRVNERYKKIMIVVVMTMLVMIRMIVIVMKNLNHLLMTILSNY